MENNLSVWRRTVDIPRREQLQTDLTTDVAVIGAGMAGVLIAHTLARRGMRVVVLEAERIASGQTQNTTAKITSQHGMIYDALQQKFGFAKAKQYARANEQAIRAYAEIIKQLNIDCDFSRVSAFLYSTSAADPLRREAGVARELGIDARFETDSDLPFPVRGVVRFDHQAQFHPLLFVKALCEDLEIYENTRVLAVENNRVRTDRGTVTAKYVVFATHYPFVNHPGWYFLRMHQERSYVLALKSDWRARGLYYGVDADGLSFRDVDGCTLLGGGNHRTGENSDGGQYDMLRRRARMILPDGAEVAHWSAQDCMTLDNIPYIGRFAASTPNWYVATGFGKWGMSTAMVAALAISGLICNDPPDWAEVFAPARFQLSKTAESLAVETAQAFKGLTREYLTVPRETLDALDPGHGGIVTVDGRKAGVYKDESGACHIVSPRCPHLGCQLEWNADERSWDCPCHGSRFHYDGSLIDNPAQTGLDR